MGVAERTMESVMEGKLGETDRSQACRTQRGMYAGYSKYHGKPLKFSKLLGAIFLLKISLEIWRED